MFKFTSVVRNSIADEMKKASILGPPFWVYIFPASPTADADLYLKGVIVVSSFIWFVMCQVAAHVVLSVQDVESEDVANGKE